MTAQTIAAAADTFTVRELMELLDENRHRIMMAIYATYPEDEWPANTGARTWQVDAEHLEQIQAFFTEQYRIGRWPSKETTR